MTTTTAPEPTPVRLSESLSKPSAGRSLKASVMAVLVTLAFVVALIPLAWILWTVVSKGYHLLLSADWWANSQRGVTSRRVGGGAYHAIVGTLEQALVTAVIAVPIGVMTAVYLVEYGRGKLAKAVAFMVDILTGIPSIVAALFVYALWVGVLGFDRVGFAVSLALVLLMIPVIVRSTEEMLKLVPNEPARGVVRARRAEVEDHREHRPADRVLRHHHRCAARPGPRHGRDGAAADPRPLLEVHQHQPVRRLHGRPADHDQPGPHRGPAAGDRPGVGRGAHARAPGHGPEPAGAPRRALHSVAK
ncbi:hypothetical protein GCM10025868_28060 [Angustibacter aerolatus]|uniref:ABC transmembrane type-1 domain-containing protein n=1 Tax=Angustibacter aerolatus TaxID=1162965 RepID=A0ABQ6JJ21_9ACTN|nr:hypothetical protein [Angustibacter aerolatus]GMA87556.1 hypothetical protein GCM10025868_28060 [Angustibacter aerolatus]